MSDLVAQWKKDEAAPFSGWDFSYLAGRHDEDRPPWDYVALARAEVERSSCLLDIQTGGGELLASLAPFPGKAFASEGYAPNVAVARARLAALGVEVRQCGEAARLPFDSESFDLVLNRHGGLRFGEIARVLRPGGTFLTQQVSGTTLSDLQARFGAKPKWPEATFTNAMTNARRAGLKIIRSEECNGFERFHDVGAIVYFLKAIPWLVDDFSVDRHREMLLGLHSELERVGVLSFAIGRYLIKAIKE
ncbi:MAG: methyltransferase domain-containing protein [Alphaproteobacteria bacterium]